MISSVSFFKSKIETLLKRFTPEIAVTFHCINRITILPEFQALEKAGRKNLWVAK